MGLMLLLRYEMRNIFGILNTSLLGPIFISLIERGSLSPPMKDLCVAHAYSQLGTQHPIKILPLAPKFWVQPIFCTAAIEIWVFWRGFFFTAWHHLLTLKARFGFDMLMQWSCDQESMT